jgi:hypothetical protein
MSTFEAELARELRALPTTAPPSLRERVRALGEPEPRRALPRIPWRGATFVLVPACLAALLAAAVVHGVLSSNRPHPASAGALTNVRHGVAASGGTERAPVHTRSLSPSVPADSAASPQALTVPGPTPARHQDYEADLRVRVDDLDVLGRRTAQAMQVTRELGGYVASVAQSSARGETAEADLVLRVPVARVEDAMIRLSALGTVLEQHVSIVDLENTVNQQRQQIRALKLQILRLTAALRQSLPADVRLRLQFQLDDARRNLAAVSGANKATLREAALSRISLSLTTQHAAAAKHERGRIGGAVSGALRFLAGAGAIALAALIVLTPIAVLIVLGWWGVRAFRRRSADRLLAAS